jgi:hypothetical protein
MSSTNPYSATLHKIGQDIWLADGPTVSFYGFAYPTRMAVIRLSDGSLFVWSPIPPTDELRRTVDALGRVAHLVTPNYLHHLWLRDWGYCYPRARLYAPPGLRKRRSDLSFDAVLGNAPVGFWARDINQIAIPGSFMMTEIVFLHRTSRTVLFGDLIENFSPDWFKGWRGRIARWDGIVSPDFGAPRELRWTFLRRKSARAAVQTILDFEPRNAVIAHGEIATGNGTEFVRRGFRWLFD